MPGRQQIPSFQIASGTTAERDGSYNLTTVGNIFYNTDTSNVEIRHVDPNNSLDWRDLVVNNKEQIDISGKLVVKDDVDVSGNITFSDSTVQNTGSPILEYISHYCDGTSLNIKNKDYNSGILTLQNVTSTQNFDAGYEEMNGSVIEYCPPQGTTLLIYEYNFCSRASHTHKIVLLRLEIKDPTISSSWKIVGPSQFGNTEYGHTNTSDSHSVKVPITIETNGVENSTTDLEAGKLKNCNNPLHFRVTASGMSGSHDWTAHRGYYVQGTPVSQPKITLIAIKQ